MVYPLFVSPNRWAYFIPKRILQLGLIGTQKKGDDRIGKVRMITSVLKAQCLSKLELLGDLDGLDALEEIEDVRILINKNGTQNVGKK